MRTPERKSPFLDELFCFASRRNLLNKDSKYISSEKIKSQRHLHIALENCSLFTLTKIRSSWFSVAKRRRAL